MFKQTLYASLALLSLAAPAVAQTDSAQRAQTGAAEPATPPADAPPPKEAQPAADKDAVAKALAERTCPLPKIANSAPLAEVPGFSLVMVPMALNGSDKQFLLDIGVKRLPEVSPALRAQLGLPQIFFPGQNITPAPGTPFGGGLTNVRVYDARNGRGIADEDLVSAGSLDIGRASGKHKYFRVRKNGSSRMCLMWVL